MSRIRPWAIAGLFMNENRSKSTDRKLEMPVVMTSGVACPSSFLSHTIDTVFVVGSRAAPGSPVPLQRSHEAVAFRLSGTKNLDTLLHRPGTNSGTWMVLEANHTSADAVSLFIVLSIIFFILYIRMYVCMCKSGRVEKSHNSKLAHVEKCAHFFFLIILLIYSRWTVFNKCLSLPRSMFYLKKFHHINFLCSWI